MPAKQNESETVVFAVSVSRATALNLVRGDATLTADRLGQVAAEMLSEIAHGGLVVDHLSMSRIAAVATVNSGADLVPLVERAVNRRRGRVVAEYELDSIWSKPLEALAQRRGQTLQQVVQDCMNNAFAMKFFYADFIERMVRPRALYFDQGEIEQMAEALGKKDGGITGRDLVEFVAGDFVVPKPSTARAG